MINIKWIVDGIEENFYDLILKDYDFKDELLEVPLLTSDIQTHLDIPDEEWIGAYVYYKGEKLKIFRSPQKTIDNTIPKYLYSVTFYGDGFVTKGIDFLDIVLGSSFNTGLRAVSFYGNIEELSNRILANLERVGEWNIIIHESVDTSLIKEVNIDGGKVFDAIKSFYDIFKVKYKFSGNTVYVGYTSENVDYSFSQGKGNGLYKLDRTPTSDLIRAYIRGVGSTNNIPINYYTSSPRFSSNPCPRYVTSLLPAIFTQGKDPDGNIVADIWEKDYYEDETLSALNIYDEDYQVFDGTDNEEIYPTITGATFGGLPIDQLKAVGAIGSDELKIDGSPVESTFNVTLNPLGFNIVDIISTQGDPILSMKTGSCAGCDFKILKINNTYVNKAKAINVYGLTKEIISLGTIWNETYPAIQLASFTRYAFDQKLVIKDAFLGAGSKVINNAVGSFDFTVSLRTYLYNTTLSQTIEVDYTTFPVPTGVGEVDLSGFKYVDGTTLSMLATQYGNWILYVDVVVSAVIGQQTPNSSLILFSEFSTEEPYMTEGDISADDGTIAPVDEDVVLTLEKNITSFNTLMPNATLKPVAGDKFVLLNVKLPDAYVISAEQRLGQALWNFLQNNNYAKYEFSLSLDSLIIHTVPGILDTIIIGNNIVIDGIDEPLEIKSVNIKHSGTEVFDTYEIQIGQTAKRVTSNQKRDTKLSKTNISLLLQQKALEALSTQTRISINNIETKAFSAPQVEGISNTSTIDSETLGTVISGSSQKATPVDADRLVLSDSADSSIAKYFTWANLKTQLKAYFDTLYSLMNVQTLGALIFGANSKTTPANNDLFAMTDSAATHIVRKISWSQLVSALSSSFAPKDSPVFTGTPTAPTQTSTDNSTKIATTAFVKTVASGITVPFETNVANIKMDGTASVGSPSNTNTVRSDHIHPTDTTRAAKNGSSLENFAAKDINATSLTLANLTLNGWVITID